MHQKKKWVFCDNHIQRSLVKLGYSNINAEYSISFKIINKLLIGFIFTLLKVTYYYLLQFLFVQKKGLKNKKAIYNLNTDQRNNKFGFGQNLSTEEMTELPDYLRKNTEKYSEWLA